MSIEFENDSVDVGVQKIEYYIDKDSSLKFLAPYIASSNFNGTIPIVDTMLTASFLKPGMTIAFNGGGVGDQYFPIVSIEFDDLDLTDSPTNLITIKYLDADSIVTSKEIDKNESVAVRYEDWDDKDLGSLGWSITSGGNAIFTNVGVRGEIEATTLDVGGVDGITYDGNTVTIGASVIINAPLTVGASGNFIVSGSAAQDIISNNTTITGGNIATGRIKSTGYSGPGTGSAFSTAGMSINLDDGSISAPNFKIDNGGNAHFKGTVQSASGNLAGFILSASQISIAGFTMSTASGIYLGSNQEFKVDIQGNLVATSASISGDIRAKSGTFSGSVTAAQIYGASVTSGILSGQMIQGASVNGGLISGQQINGGLITGASVTSGWIVSGSLNSGLINSTSINGSIINGASVNAGIVTGQNIIGASVTGGVISGQKIIGGTIIGASGTFTGDLTATNLTASVGNIGGFNITKDSLNANNFAISTSGGLALGSASQFYVDTSGNLIANSASLTGNITANSGRFLGPVGVNGAGLIYAGNDPETGQRVILTSSGLFGFDSGNINIFSLPITGSPTIAGFTVVNTGLTGSGQMANMIFGNRGDNAYNITVRGDKTGGQAAAIYTTVNGVATTSNANNGFYLDDTGKMRLAGSNGSLTFDGSNLSVTGNITATSGSFSGWLKSASITSGIISSGSFVGGILQSAGYSGATDGSAFSTTGTHLNLNTGAITGKQFRIDSSGNAVFGGSLNSGISISSPTISGGSISGNSISGGSISATSISGTDITGGTISGTTITGGTIRTAQSGGRVELGSTPYIFFHSGNGSQLANTGFINTVNSSGGTQLQLNFNGPAFNNLFVPSINLYATSTESQVTIQGTSIVMSTVNGISFTGTLSGNGSGLTNLNGTNIATGTVDAARISNLDAGKITTGTFATARIPTNISITGNAATVTNGVYTDGTYNNPSWITALGGNKITGNISGNAYNITQYGINQNLNTTNSVKFDGGISSTGVYTNGLSGTGRRTVNVNSSGVIGYDASTYNLKNNILPLLNEQLKIEIPENRKSSEVNNINYMNILELTPVSFQWDEDNTIEIGLIAEEVKEVFPIAYQDGETPTYNRNMIMISMLSVIKNQQKIIEDLQSRMLQLESQLGG